MSFERFLPERQAHSASDLAVPIGSLAARLWAMRSVQLFPGVPMLRSERSPQG